MENCVFTSKDSHEVVNDLLVYLRSSMGQERFSDLALLNVEKSVTDSITFQKILYCT